VAGAVVRAPRDLALDRLDQRRMGVPQEQGAVTHPVVDVLPAVDVPLAWTRCALDVEREGRQVPAVVGDTARDHPPRALPARPRARQGLPIPLGACLPHHAVSSSLAAATGPRRVFRCPTNPLSASSNAWCSPSGKLSTESCAAPVIPSIPPARTIARVNRASSAAV